MTDLHTISTPFYLLDEQAIVKNLQKIRHLCDRSGAKALLALKCFASWGVFGVMKPYLHGTTSSSLYEVKLGKEEFGGETHAYSVAYSSAEIDEVLTYADKIIFNSFNQLAQFGDKATAKNIPVGLRLNPQISNSSFLIADPARPFSRLGEHDLTKILQVADKISGVMIHYNCENNDFDAFADSLDVIGERFGELLHRLDWVSLGGGIHFIGDHYPIDQLADKLKAFAEHFGVQVYLEPGEACVHFGASLHTTVLDILENGKPLAVVDSSIESHCLDLLIYRYSAPLVGVNDSVYQIAGGEFDGQNHNPKAVRIYGKSCLAGDIFGDYELNEPLGIGDRVIFGNAGAYTLVKKNWFNGVNMPSVVIRRLDGQIAIQKTFGYGDYKASLS